ncbi:TetR/AcrR family transcriptional regulator C-terminal domain-containing protein [Amorphus sp. 3PC139-8]|uniref:TetR/AcrR family transcriptional regulator C-terminal domain-containing protein n=1 Tax=Amorphus sp. 3PC139-8 TaxID=2735676 RepID=UPI00345D653F
MGLERDDVVRAAIDVLDKGGLEGLTMRKVAAELNIRAPSIYWHFPNKHALIDGIADALIANVRIPDKAEGLTWQERLQAIARELRRCLLAHRDGARLFAGTYVVTDNVLRVAEPMLAALSEAGLSPEEAATGSFTLLYMVLGFTAEEQALDPTVPEALDLATRRDAFEQLAATRYPYLLRAAAQIFDTNFDARFEASIDLIIRGAAAERAGT